MGAAPNLKPVPVPVPVRVPVLVVTTAAQGTVPGRLIRRRPSSGLRRRRSISRRRR
jgi:hypothetical protein